MASQIINKKNQSVTTKTQTIDIPKATKNRLALEKSPYLLQHATNPVDWYPWGDEAFEKAKRENKPIFLSIGYSTCHWCHVMEHESFEDPQVAKLMNEVYVCIKVDREERPDIDAVYMNVCQMMTGSGGWPLTIIMTPEKKPFYAGTYFPKTTRMSRIGMIELTGKINDLWKVKQTDLLASADRITEAVAKFSQATAGSPLGRKDLKKAFLELEGRYDSRYGGFGTAPKFPTPHNLTFLLRYGKRTGDKKAVEMVEKTLQKMRRGGIYDHIGFGFHRYSTDHQWLTPHFEKMLYDQALMTIACVEAYQATGKQEYATTAHEIISYVLRDMTAPNGGFYSAEDADSEGVEGKFYVWSKEELESQLSKEDAKLTIAMFSVTPEGNFNEEATGQKTGNNILNLEKTLDKTAESLNITVQELTRRWDNIRQTLYVAREKRIHPYKDDKILTDWNGLMITALAKAARAFDRPDYAQAAQRCADFIQDKMTTSDQRLLHRYRQGHAGITAPLDDYAFMIWALTELYEANFNTKNLTFAQTLSDHLNEYFWDDLNDAFFFTPDDGEKLLVRSKEIYDGAVPSGNSVAMLALLRLARITADTNLEEKAAKIALAFAGQVIHRPSTYTQLMSAIDFASGPTYEIVIAGEPGTPETKNMLNAIRSQYIPNKVVLLRPADTQNNPPEITKIAPYTADQITSSNKTTAYICQNYQCNLPTTDPKEMLKMISTSEDD